VLNALHTGRTAPKCRVQHYIVCGPVCHSGLRRLLHTQRVVQVQPQVLEAVDLGDNQANMCQVLHSQFHLPKTRDFYNGGVIFFNLHY